MITADISAPDRCDLSLDALPALSLRQPRPGVRLRPRRAKKPRISGLARALAPWLAAPGLLGVACAALGCRTAIVSLAPASAAVYERAGLPVNRLGLAIEDVRAVASLSGADGPELTVTGEIVNLRGRETPAPNLGLALRGGDGMNLYVWTARAPKGRLAPGERSAFRATSPRRHRARATCW